jgi:hypothetical protein
MMSNKLIVLDFDPTEHVTYFETSTGVELIVGGDNLALLVSHKCESDVPSLLDLEDRREATKFDALFWVDNGWNPSVFHFAAGLHQKYTDIHDHSGRIRRATLDAYKKSEPLPGRVRRGESYYKLAFDYLNPPLVVETEKCLLQRRTHRSFRRQRIPLSQFSNILYYGLENVRVARRNAAESVDGELISFGSAIETYVVNFDVDELELGVFHYDVMEHSLFPVRGRVKRRSLVRFLNLQPAPLTAAFVMIFVLYFDQSSWRYRHEKALTNQFVEVGRIAHDVIFHAEYFGLKAFMTPAVREAVGSWLCRVHIDEGCAIYALALGAQKRRPSYDP